MCFIKYKLYRHKSKYNYKENCSRENKNKMKDMYKLRRDLFIYNKFFFHNFQYKTKNFKFDFFIYT